MREGSPFDEPPTNIFGSAAELFQFVFLCKNAALKNTDIIQSILLYAEVNRSTGIFDLQERLAENCKKQNEKNPREKEYQLKQRLFEHQTGNGEQGTQNNEYPRRRN